MLRDSQSICGNDFHVAVCKGHWDATRRPDMLFTDILLTVLSYAIVPVILYIAYVKFRGPEHEKSLQIPAANRKRVTIRAGVIAALVTSPLIFLYLASWEMAVEKLQALGRLLMLFLLLPLGVVIALVFAIVLNVLAAKERQK